VLGIRDKTSRIRNTGTTVETLNLPFAVFRSQVLVVLKDERTMEKRILKKMNANLTPKICAGSGTSIAPDPGGGVKITGPATLIQGK
jgi:hypothetical protein